ncbi:hypothetical protein RUND412_002072 [Rhizina undulata]
MMSATDTDDPFIQFQTSDVHFLLTTTRQSFSSYLRIRSLASSPSSHELKSAYEELRQHLNELATDIEELSSAVAAVERDPYKYGLEIEEVARRRRVVEEWRGEVGDMAEELSRSSSNLNAIAVEGEGEGAGGDSYTQFELQQQQELIANQDEVLDGVYKTVGNLREQAHIMNRELEEQVELLEDVERDAERIERKLRVGVKNLGSFIRKNEDTASSCCIGVLIMVLIVLLVLVLVI